MEWTAFDAYERQSWRGQAQAYADSFAGLCGYTADALLDAAGVGAGVAALDVGTGIGTVAANAVERGAVVTAVDAEPAMVAWTRDRLPSATVAEAILPELPFEDAAFGATVANFVVNHVGDPAGAVRELRRVTATGGKVAVTIWPNPAPPLQMLWHHCFEAAGAVRPQTPVVDDDRNFPRTTEGLRQLISGAGLTDVSAWSLEWVHRADPGLWWSGPAAGLGSAGAVLAAQTPDVRERIRAEYDRRVGAWLELPTTAILAVGDEVMARYTTSVTRLGERVFVPVPFDPDAEWTPKPKHHIHGTVGGCRVRAVITTHDGQRGFIMGTVWASGFEATGTVEVDIAPEGPQRADLDPDIAEALDDNPAAGAFFDSLAQFYRKAYLKWIDGTRRRPDLRAQRIGEMVALLESGRKERPRS